MDLGLFFRQVYLRAQVVNRAERGPGGAISAHRGGFPVFPGRLPGMAYPGMRTAAATTVVHQPRLSPTADWVTFMVR